MKLKPYLLLFILIIILAFIIGARYGQKVEQTNKAINYVLSIPPTKPPPPTVKPLQFKTYKNEDCGLQFLYPSTVSLEEETTASATFAEKNNPVIIFSCEKNNDIAAILKDGKVASEEIQFQNKKLVTKTKQDYLYWQFKNPKNLKNIFVSINKNLLPLFDNSLQFISH